MAILIANLGNSDLSVKLNEFDFYLPIFERREPNQKTSHLTTEELDVWNEKNIYAGMLCEELKVEYPISPKTGEPEISFLEFSKKLLHFYKNDFSSWHDRIRPGRIGGTILEAKNKFNVRNVYLFVTKQEPIHKSDTFYLMEILKLWFKREYNNEITIQEIPVNIAVNEIDELLDYYYNFFINHIKDDEPVLVSIKGGTNQMQTALKMQSLASSVSRLIFIDPQLDISKSLAGEFSDCQLTSYWRYMRTQKYQTVKLLLDENHWDFNGAIQILQSWKAVLKFLIQHEVVNSQEISDNNQFLSKVIKTLNLGINCFNLDIKSAQYFLHKNSQLAISSTIINEIKNYDVNLNLYTQCRIYWQINQIANFLSRTSSFYESILVSIAKKIRCYDRDHFNKNLKNRYEKIEFIESKIRLNNISEQIQHWEEVVDCLESLEFWCIQRNNLIHSAEGVSKEKMQELFEQEKHKKPQTCAPHLILQKMSTILVNDLGIIKREYKHKFVDENQEYYIYSAVKNWVVQTLNS